MRYTAAALSLSVAGLASASTIRVRDGHLAGEEPVVEEHPAPVEEHPAPVEEAPVEEWPAPVEEAPVAEQWPAAEELYPPIQDHPQYGEVPAGMHGYGLNENTENHVVLVWWNNGGGEENHPINDQITVTETVTVGGHYTPPPVAEHPPPEGEEHIPPPPVAEEHPTEVVPDEHTEVVPGTGATHTVVVGGEDLLYYPEELHATVGDMVIFQFFNENHTATQSSFDEPCAPLPGGMDSGFIPNPEDGIEPAPEVAMQIMTEDPLWFYCAQGPHCAKGMVFSINPTEERTHAMFKDLATKSGEEAEDADIVEEGGEEEVIEEEVPVEGEEEIVDEEAPVEDLPPVEGEEEFVEDPAIVGGGEVKEGVGHLEGGACYCQVECGVGAWPNLDSQGVGASGGWGGSVPWDGPEARRRKF